MLSQGRQDVERLVDDTRGLLQAQADRLYGTHAAVDRTQYHVSTSAARYYLGEPIVVRWRVPPTHCWTTTRRVAPPSSGLCLAQSLAFCASEFAFLHLHEHL